MPKLVISRPEGETETFDITEDSFTIGRAPENAIPLDDIGCSRRHCQIMKISKGFEITDLKSRNGLKVNGAKKERHKLRDGDVIEVGKVKLTFYEGEVPDPDAEEEVGVGGSCFLVFAGGERKGKKVSLAADRTTVGRKASNTLILDDAMTSSYHCEITKEAGGYVLRDMGSTNGSVVNGEPVSEVALNHGDRLRLGKSVLVFADPAVANYESTIAQEEEAEAEWGMMRDQMDFARVKRARRAATVWTLFFVLLLGGAAAYLLTNPEMVKDALGIEEIAGAKTVAGNRIDDFSFEEGLLSWAIPEEKPGSALVTVGPSHQGEKALFLIGPEEEKGYLPAFAPCGKEITVGLGQSYEVSAWVSPSAGAAACVGVQWIMSGDQPVNRTSLSPWAAGPDWSEVKAVVSPPAGANSARVVLMVLGAQGARFDDVVFKKSGAGARKGRSFTKGTFQFGVEDHGVLSVAQMGEQLLWGGGPVAVLAGDRFAFPELAFRADSFSGDAGGASAAGKLRLPEGVSMGASAKYTLAEDRLRVELTVGDTPDGVEAVGFSLRVAKAYLSDGATLSGDLGAREIRVGTDEEGVRKVILGGSGRRLIVSSETPARIRMVASGGLHLMLLLPPGGGTHVFNVISDFSGMQQEATKLLSQATGAKSAGRLGEAMNLFTRVANEFPFDDVSRSSAERKIKDLDQKGQSALAEVQSLFEGAQAKDYCDLGDLSQVEKRARELAVSYEGFPVLSDPAAELATVAATKVADAGKVGLEAAAGRLLSRAKDFSMRGDKVLAAEFAGWIITEYPDTEAAAEARELLK